MSLYKRPLSQFWWFQIWTTEGQRVRKSTGTDDRAKAAIIEQACLMAYGKKTALRRNAEKLPENQASRSEPDT